MRLIPKFTFYIYLFQTDLFHPKFMINAMSLIGYSKFCFLGGDVLRSTSYGIYISQFIQFA